MSELPKIISVDDHVLEPPNVWQDRLPADLRDRGPRIVRKRGRQTWDAGKTTFTEDDGPGSRWTDIWLYDDLVWPHTAGFAMSRLSVDDVLDPVDIITYDDMLPGCYEQSARLADMDANHVEASICFPTYARFCGQTFAERADKDFALICIRAYNDWMIDEWCGGAGYGRLIPLTLIPLWDGELAAAEVRRCAAKGSFAIAFSENPAALGYASIHSGGWEPLWAACEDTGTVVNMHIGSSSRLSTTSADAPLGVVLALTAQNSMAALVDWLLSGILARHAKLKIALSEGQVGWMPYILERTDSIWERGDVFEVGMQARVPNRPSSYVNGQVYGCVFDDVHGLASRAIIGMEQIMFEVDYPHADSTFPLSLRTAEKLVANANLSEHEAWQMVRGNAIECYGLERFGINE
jgi:predicted TIM-barrel fold metal-dependent hydrolase